MHSRYCLPVLALGIMVGALEAQGSPIQKGSWQVAGTASFTHSRDIGNDAGFTTLEVLPRVGYFIVRGLAVSANLQFTHNSDEGTSQTEWGVGPGLTYYIDLHSRHFYPFLSARTLFTWDNTDYHAPLPPSLNKGSSRVWLLSGGGLLMLGQHVGISGELFYQHERFASRFANTPQSVNRGEVYGVQWGVAAFIF